MQSSNPLISIITPVFNVEPYLAETIESVIQQTYSNWELILVDDGSIDNSPAIAKTFASKFPGKIFYFEHPKHTNRGASASRNLGLAKARGALLSFLDSDDYLLPNKLEEQVKIFIQNPTISVVCEATKYWYSWANVQAEDIIVPVGAKPGRVYHPPALATLLYPLGDGAGFCTCGLLFKSDVFQSKGGFDERFTGKNQLFEDQVFFLKLCLHEKVYISSLCNNLYRQRPDSLMHGLEAEGYDSDGKYFFLNWLKAYLRQHNIRHKNIYWAIQKAYLFQQFPLLQKLWRKSTLFIEKVRERKMLL